MQHRAFAVLGSSIDDFGMPLDFDVIAYRGAMVASRDAWLADIKSRGGVFTRVPGGFFHDASAARFGAAPPYTYELAPAWLLIWDGVDVATDEFLSLVHYQDVITSDDNQLQQLATVAHAASSAGDLLQYLPWMIGALFLVNVVGLIPRGRRA